MSDENYAFENISLTSSYYPLISYTTRFWLFLSILIPSIICSFFVLYHLLFSSVLRHTLMNHITILIMVIGLICEITNYPWMLYYYQHQGQWERSLLFCETWAFLDWGLYVTQTILFAWATIERHILIFYDNWVATRNKRILVHYFPAGILLSYCLIFYSIVYFFPPCQQFIIPELMICTSTCVSGTQIVSAWEAIVHQVLPAFIILLFSSTLLARVVWQKHRMRQPFQWRKHRKMTIQLISIASLYITFFLPYVIALLADLCTYPYSAFGNSREYLAFLSYLLLPTLPFVCGLSLPELRSKLIKILPIRRHEKRVVPLTIPLGTIVNNSKR